MSKGGGPTTIIGHSGALALLQRSEEVGRLSHAYLFVGPQNVGKMALALHLAMTVNCAGESIRSCGSCSQCVRIASGQHADVLVVGVPEGEQSGPTVTRIKIEAIRELQKQASLYPYEGKIRVFIIDGAELLTREAANSLLKTLEEPPPRILLLLLTSNEAEVLPTILSRCQKVNLRPVDVLELAQSLQEKFGVDGDKAELVARLSGGCPGWAVRALTAPALLEERLDFIIHIIEAIEGDIECRFGYAANLVNLFSNNRRKALQVLDIWISWWRDLLLTRGGARDRATNVHQLEVLTAQVQSLQLEDIKGTIENIELTQRWLDHNVNPRIALEAFMLKLPRPTPSLAQMV